MAQGTSLNSSFLYPSSSLSLSPPPLSPSSPSLSPLPPPLSSSSLLSPSSSSPSPSPSPPPPPSLSPPPSPSLSPPPPSLSPPPSPSLSPPPPEFPLTACHSSSSEFLSVIVERDEGKRCGLAMNAECRICQEDDKITSLEAPCNCSGSLKYAHRKCVQRWCNEKGDTICEICRQPYRNGYTIPPQPVHPEDSIAIEFSEEWDMSGPHPLEFRHPRILAMAAAQHHFLEAASDYDDFAEANSRGASLCRSLILILMAMLLLRHALAMVASTEDQDSTMFLALFLLRAAGFLLPCFIMIHAMNMLQRRQQQQEVAMAATEVARLLQAGQARGVQLTLSSGLSTTGHM